MALVLLCIAALVLGCVALSRASTVELTDDNFYDYAKEKGSLLVEFYAPWCSDCTKLAPEYERAATKLGTRGSDMAKIDCFGAGKCICSQYGVKTWPQLKTFKHGVYTGEYIGQQTGDEMANYVNYAAATAGYVDSSLKRQVPANPCARQHMPRTSDNATKDDTADDETSENKEEETADDQANEKKEKDTATDQESEKKEEDTATDKASDKKEETATAEQTSKKKEAEESADKRTEEETKSDKEEQFVQSQDKETITLKPSPGTTVKACIKCDIPKPEKKKKKNEKKENQKKEKKSSGHLKTIASKKKFSKEDEH